MKKKFIVILITCLALFSYGYSAKERVKLSRKEKNKIIKNLNEKHRHWLNLITHISFKEERNIFLKLTNNREREIFIRTFWQQRDPTPGTVENEYKNEIEKRYAYVLKNFKRGSPRPAWMTDMGKFYMILGEPNSIERFESKAGLFPAQVWYYYGDQSLGLPTYFNITFYKPNNTTEWKHYNPAFDGPAALLIRDESIDPTNYESLYLKIRELAAPLAMPAMTMIPNQISRDYRPSARTNIILSSIHDAPKKRINVSYATHFLNYKGYVDVDQSSNYISNSKLVSLTRYERFGLNFVNISIKPKKISVGYSEEKGQYYFNYELNVSLKKGDDFIYEYKKNFDFYIDPDKVNSLKGNGIVIHDSFPVIPGKYKLMVFMMNSVAKEFTYFDENITVPPPGQTPLLATPLVGYKSETQPDNFFFSYRFGDKKLFVDTGHNFKLREQPVVLVGVYNLDKKLWEKGKVQLELIGMSERTNFIKKYDLALGDYLYKKDLNILYPLVKEGLNSDYYELNINLVDENGNKLDTKKIDFSVSPLSTFAYAMETFKKSRADNPYYFNYILACQYEKAGNISEAEKYYEKCVSNNPGFSQGRVAYIDVLNKRKKFDKALEKIEHLKGNEKTAFDYHRAKGTALYGKKDYKEALKSLLSANEIYNSDIRVLNLLGFTFLNLNDYPQALNALEASLSLNDKQQFIQKTVEKVKKKTAKK